MTLAGLGGDDTLILEDIGVTEVAFDGGQGADTYQINAAASTVKIYAYDSGTAGVDQLFVNGGSTDDTFVVDMTQTTINASTIYYDDSFERFTVNGRDGRDRITINGHPPVITNFPAAKAMIAST